MREAAGSPLALWDGLCAASSDSASKLFSCVSGFSVSAAAQNTWDKKKKKGLDATFPDSSKRCFRWVGFVQGDLCRDTVRIAGVVIFVPLSVSLRCSAPLSSRARGDAASSRAAVARARSPCSHRRRCRAAAAARSLCLCSPLVGGCKHKWSCLRYWNNCGNIIWLREFIPDAFNVSSLA